MPRIDLFGSMDVSGSALSAQRARLNAIARNIANASTTRTEDGGPYRRQEVLIESVPDAPEDAKAPAPLAPSPLRTARDIEAAQAAGAPLATEDPAAAAEELPPLPAPAASGEVPGGVRITGIAEDDSEMPKVYDPSHPDADEDGFVTMPNVNMINEMVDMMLASRAYEANLAAMNTSKDLLMKTLTIGKQ